MKYHHRYLLYSQNNLSLITSTHWKVGRERDRWGQGELKLLGLCQGSLGVVNLRVGKEGTIRELIPQGGSQHILTLLSPFSEILLSTRKDEGRKRVDVKW